jgi:hypothetical protein
MVHLYCVPVFLDIGYGSRKTRKVFPSAGPIHAGQNRYMRRANKSFENLAQFRYLGMTVTNQDVIQEEIKRRLNSGNACYHSVQNLLSSRLISKNVKLEYIKYNFVCGSVRV